MGELLVTAVAILTGLVGLLTALGTYLKSRARSKDAEARVAEAQAAAAVAQAELAETLQQQQQLGRPSLAPEASWAGETPWTAALNDLGQRLEGLITGVSDRVGRLGEQYDRLDAQQDAVREKVGYLEGVMNGRGRKKE